MKLEEQQLRLRQECSRLAKELEDTRRKLADAELLQVCIMGGRHGKVKLGEKGTGLAP